MRHRQQRRGISEVVGVLLMLAVIVSLGVLVFTFASGSMSTLGGGYAAAMSNKGGAAAEKFSVEQVAFSTGAPAGADMFVRNVGGIPTTLVAVYITDMTSKTFVSQSTIHTTVGVGAFGEIPPATLSFTPSHGDTYSFTVTSSLGNSVIYDAEMT